MTRRVRITSERITTRLTDITGDTVGTSSYLAWYANCADCTDSAGGISLPRIHEWATRHPRFCVNGAAQTFPPLGRRWNR